MAVDPATAAAESAVWVQQFTLASEQLKASAAAAAESTWAGFTSFYSQAAVATAAAETAAQSVAAQQVAAGLAASYVTGVVAAATGLIPGPAPLSIYQDGIRNSADLVLVHHRPANTYKKAIAFGATHEEALVKAGVRAANLIVTDLTLQERSAMQSMLAQWGITQYRRVIRPELSKTGTCGLCIVASDQIYKTGDLMPLHPPSCNCIVLPIVGDVDPGQQLNAEDLEAIYAEAGSTRAEDLRKTRYVVHQHGELGPMLAKAGDSFRGPDKVRLEDDPERAARMLTKIQPVLVSLQERRAAGENVDDALEYQRNLVNRLSSIVGVAA